MSANNDKDDKSFSPQEFKQDARDARLSLKSGQEEVLRKKLQHIAKQKCDAETRAFAECAQKEGLWVIWSCRKQCDEMNKCLEKYYNQEEFHKFAEQHGFDRSSLKKSWK